MSREIKFRAWIKQSWDSGSQKWAKNKMLYNAYPYLYTKVCLPDSGIGFANEGEFELMQYTGLKDKNNKEIYEGDIVVQNCYLWFDDGKPNYRGTVEMIYQQWQVIAHCINPNKQGISDGMNEPLNFEGFEDNEKSNWEVIGNIYENPELL